MKEPNIANEQMHNGVMESVFQDDGMAPDPYLTRRRFLKRSGGATIASALAASVIKSYALECQSGSLLIPEGNGPVEILNWNGRDFGLDWDLKRKEWVTGINPATHPTDPGVQWSQQDPAAGETQQPYTLPHEKAKNGGKDPNYFIITVNVKPPEAAASVKFTPGGTDPGLMTHDVLSRCQSSGEIKVAMTSRRDSTPKGPLRKRDPAEFWIDASHANATTVRAVFYVVKPKWFVKTPNPNIDETVARTDLDLRPQYEVDTTIGQATLSTLTPGQQATLVNVYMHAVDIKILNQFDEPLDFYGGSAVRENGIWIDWMRGDQYKDHVWATAGVFSTTQNPLGYVKTWHHIFEPSTWTGQYAGGIHNTHLFVMIGGHTIANGLDRTTVFTKNVAGDPLEDPWPPTPANEDVVEDGYLPHSLFMRMTWL